MKKGLLEGKHYYFGFNIGLDKNIRRDANQLKILI